MAIKEFPQVDGPKLQAFDHGNGPLKIGFIEHLGNGAHGNVWKVSINDTVYALKLFQGEDASCSQINTYDCGMEEEQLIPWSSPFACEARAFARLKETDNEHLAIRCHGFLMLEGELKDRVKSLQEEALAEQKKRWNANWEGQHIKWQQRGSEAIALSLENRRKREARAERWRKEIASLAKPASLESSQEQDSSCEGHDQAESGSDAQPAQNQEMTEMTDSQREEERRRLLEESERFQDYSYEEICDEESEQSSLSIPSGTPDWQPPFRIETRPDEPIPAIVKDFVDMPEESRIQRSFPRGERSVRAFFQAIKTLHSIGILLWDVSNPDNLYDGKLLEFSCAVTVPHPCLNTANLEARCHSDVRDRIGFWDASGAQRMVDIHNQEVVAGHYAGPILWTRILRNENRKKYDNERSGSYMLRNRPKGFDFEDQTPGAWIDTVPYKGRPDLYDWNGEKARAKAAEKSGAQNRRSPQRRGARVTKQTKKTKKTQRP